MAEQTGQGTVLVSWTPPPTTPSGGYRITVVNTSDVQYTSLTSKTLTDNSPGVYSIVIESLSHHLPSEPVGPVEVTVRGEHHPP